MSRITEYTSVSAFDENDVLIKDGENGTKIISVEDAAAEFRRLCGINGDISDITDSLSAFGANLAGVETTFIATKNYNIGDLFVIDNVLYRATATIASGSEIDPETNCEETSFSTVIEAMNDILANKANVDGSYSTLTAGNAEQLVGTVFAEDDAAYTFRTAGGSADIGDREYDEIVGGSIVWNQMTSPKQAVNEYTKFGVTLTKIDGKMAFTATGTFETPTSDPNLYIYSPPDLMRFLPGHKYLVTNTSKHFCVLAYKYSADSGTFTGNRVNVSDQRGIIVTVDNALRAMLSLRAGTNIPDGTVIDETIYINVFDLTQMFGSEIADYIYNLEQTTPGAGVTWFRKYFPKDYYEYNPGELMHVSDLQSHDMVGFNAWDEEWELGRYDETTGETVDSNNSIRSKSTNYIPVFPNTVYRCSYQQDVPIVIFFYDADKNFVSSVQKSHDVFTTPANAYYIRFRMSVDYGTTYNHDICINLSWDGERDGEYEPYVKHSYPLDSSLTLRGIPKLSTDGKLYYDGDHYKSDGTVERRYGIVDLGTLDWGYTSLTYGGVTFNAFRSGANDIPAKIHAKNICEKYTSSEVNRYAEELKNLANDKTIWAGSAYWSATSKRIAIHDDAYSDAASFKAAMSGVYLVYELEEPTTETATAYQSPQIVDDFGTEEYVTSSIVPVGHFTQYDSNLRAKLEMAPNNPDGDGDYLVRQTSGQNEYVPYTDGGRITALEGKIPSAPSTDGAYVLKCTVADGTPTYSWVSA